MTKREAAILSAFTGIMVGEFADMQAYVDELLGETTFTLQYGSRAFADRVKEAARPDFIRLNLEIR